MKAIGMLLLIDNVRHMHLKRMKDWKAKAQFSKHKFVRIESEIVPEVAASLCAYAKASECRSNGYHRLLAMQC